MTDLLHDGSRDHGQGRSLSYEGSGLDLLGSKSESSPTIQLLKGPTVKALASGGVHTGGGTCSSVRRMF